jgi:nucleoside-diphosphate-sugar epimerase
MAGRVFIAGAGGAIGRPLCRMLVFDGWDVTGTTRSPEKATALRALGIVPVVVDVYDGVALAKAVVAAKPEAVIHQLTDLPPALDPARMAAARAKNNRIRDEGTRNLVAAAIAAGATRLIAQSISFAYAAGPRPYAEDAPIDPAMTGVISLEQQVLEAPLVGIVLRYGHLYGPGTGFDAKPKSEPIHVDEAADAARLALTRGARGIYNVAEDDGAVVVAKAVRELGWRPGVRLAQENA